jgi:hypothetical protein
MDIVMFNSRIAALGSLAALLTLATYSQSVVEGTSPGSAPILTQSTLAAFESIESGTDSSCTVAAQKPVLGLDLKFHSGYQLSVPVQELDALGDTLTVLFRITSSNHPNQPVYFQEHFLVPALDEHARGDAGVPGRFDLGAGSYRVELLIHDRIRRLCAVSWELTATPSAKDRNLPLALGSGEIRPVQQDVFLMETAPHEAKQGAVKIKLLVNFVPPSPSSAALDHTDIEALVSILRNIARDPRVGTISLVAFNLYEERVIFRQEYGEGIDFPALGKSLNKLNPGTVGVDQLLRKHGSTEFLAELVKGETGGGSDALIFVGPKAFVEGNVPPEEMKQIRELGCPVFYLNYVNNPQGAPWRDSIGRMVKFLRGYEFSITAPRDLWNAVTDTVARIFDSRSTSLAKPAGEARQ